MLRSGRAVRSLNVAVTQRLSVALVFAACALLVLAAAWPTALVGAVAAAITVTLLNVQLYRFFARRRGLWFAIESVLPHWLYFICCGLSVPLGFLSHVRTRWVGPETAR
jgi:hypothetical protein